jgi:hypothetical protein
MKDWAEYIPYVDCFHKALSTGLFVQVYRMNHDSDVVKVINNDKVIAVKFYLFLIEVMQELTHHFSEDYNKISRINKQT